jgi:hypothetical protein
MSARGVVSIDWNSIVYPGAFDGIDLDLVELTS